MLTVVFLIMEYLSTYVSEMKLEDLKTQPAEMEYSWKYFFNQAIYWGFILGVHAQKDQRNYTFIYQSSGYLVLLLFLVFERKASQWLRFKPDDEDSVAESVIYDEDEPRSEMIEKMILEEKLTVKFSFAEVLGQAKSETKLFREFRRESNESNYQDCVEPE